MRKRWMITALAAVLWVGGNAQERFRVADDLEVVKLSDRAYVYTATADMGKWGLVPSNGVILVSGGKAMMLDTPVNDDQTGRLVDWAEKNLDAEMTGFVANHWHDDCIGGLACLHERGVRSYAHEMTVSLAEEKGMPVPQEAFRDSLTIRFGGLDVVCFYPGAGHALDNIVVWIPQEKLLFGGCLVKDLEADNLGNTADGDVEAWPQTVRRVQARYPEAEIVVPGHGRYGGPELLEYTVQLVERHTKR